LVEIKIQNAVTNATLPGPARRPEPVSKQAGVEIPHRKS
jgi:hypothetical protein